jgi:hypothetical protein
VIAPSLGWHTVDRIISEEVRRMKLTAIPGHDAEDFLQEGRIVVFKQQKLLLTRSPTYLRIAVRNAFSNLLRAAGAQKRTPVNVGEALRSFDASRQEDANLLIDETTPESLLIALQIARRYRVYAQGMDYSALYPASVKAPQLSVPGDESFSPCHVDAAADSAGYDLADPICHQCVDKFTCLPRALQLGRVAGCEADHDAEVAALRAGEVAYTTVLARMAERHRILKSNGVIPEELLVRTRPPRELEERIEVRIADVLPKPPAPPADLPEPEPRKRRPGKVRAPRQREPRAGGRYSADRMPKAGTLTEAVMADKIARASRSMGLPAGRVLEIGHVIVKRRYRTGRPDVEVTVERDGFRLNLDGEKYPSLSACAMAAELPYSNAKTRNTSGPLYFSVVVNHNVEVRDARGLVIASKRS